MSPLRLCNAQQGAATCRTFLNIFSFAAILYSISPAACYGVLVYSITGTLIATKGFGPWLGFYQLQRVKQEAGLRLRLRDLPAGRSALVPESCLEAHLFPPGYDLIRVRENAESVAFFEGGEAEWSKFNTLFSGLLQTVYRSVLVTSGFGMFNRSFHWATFAVAPLLVGPAYLRGEVQFGVISQASMAFNIILGAAAEHQNLSSQVSLTGSVEQVFLSGSTADTSPYTCPRCCPVGQLKQIATLRASPHRTQWQGKTKPCQVLCPAMTNARLTAKHVQAYFLPSSSRWFAASYCISYLADWKRTNFDVAERSPSKAP